MGREELFHPGDIVRHFKRRTVSEEVLSAEPQIYLYRIVGIAEHTESGEPLMIYRALYGDGRLYARPLSMFLSPVDKNKYPDAGQTFRFERLEPIEP